MSTDGSSFYFNKHHHLWLSLFQCLELSKTSTQLDIQDTKLRGIIAYIGMAAQSFEYFIRMQLHSQWCRTTSLIQTSHQAFDKITFSQHCDRESKAATSYSYSYSTRYFSTKISSQHHICFCFPARNRVVAKSVSHCSIYATRQRHTESKNIGLLSVWSHLQLYQTTTSNRQDFGSAN